MSDAAVDEGGAHETARADEFRDFAAGRTGHLYRSACLLTAGDTHLAEDLVQETLGRVYAMWGRIARIDNPAGHAQSLLVRTYLGHHRLHPAGERPPEHLPGTPSGRSDDPARRIALPRTGPWWCCGTGRTAAWTRPPTP